MTTIRDILDRSPSREIEEVIKVDQGDLGKMGNEIEEYVATESISRRMAGLFEGYYGSLTRPSENVGIWVSGFFGSGKSSFAKLFGIAVGNLDVVVGKQQVRAGQALRDHIGDARITSVLSQINERIPTHLVILDISTEQLVRSSNQKLTEVLYRKLLTSFGYAADLDLAELEFSLVVEGKIDAFRSRFESSLGKTWDNQKRLPAVAINQASRILHEIDPQTYPAADSWSNTHRNRHDVNPEKLANRALELLSAHKPGNHLLFVVDEVGQYVARDVSKMLDLQGIVQTLGRVGSGKLWLMVTAQEKLTEVVGALGDSRIELARLMDRFPAPDRQVHLEQSDITEVTSRRVLQKNATGQDQLKTLFQANRGRLQAHTKVTCDTRYPELDQDNFVRMYPLLPYQVDLVIAAVSGLRTQGGASQHVGGANRTIIKLTQQLLVNPGTDLAGKLVGTLVGLDQIYDLVEGNIASELRERIHRIHRDHADNPWMVRVAKCVCLLTFASPYHRTTENIAAMLHQAVDGDSVMDSVRLALEELEQRHLIRKDDKGWKIPTPAEEDWEKTKQGIQAKPGDLLKLYRELLGEALSPQPKWDAGARDFKASLLVDGHTITQGDIEIRLNLVEPTEWTARLEELRAESRSEKSAVRWALRVEPDLRILAESLHRSIEVIARKGREQRVAQGGDTQLLRVEEKNRDNLRAELRSGLSLSLMNGQVWFRGNDRTPTSGTSKNAKDAIEKVLSQVATDVFDRYSELAVPVKDKDIEQTITSPGLDHLPDVVSQLKLLVSHQGKTSFQVESGLLAEVGSFITEQNGYGRAPTGKQIAEHFERSPYGWPFDSVRLLVLCLFRADRIDATSQSELLDSIQHGGAKNLFRRNNDFRSATFRPRKEGLELPEKAAASEAFQSIWGQAPSGLEEGTLAQEIRDQVAQSRTAWQDARDLLLELRLPGEEPFRKALELSQQLVSQRPAKAIQLFLSEKDNLKQAIRRANELRTRITEGVREDLRLARVALEKFYPEWQGEPDAEEAVTEDFRSLDDLLQRETFHEHLAEIRQRSARASGAYASLRQGLVSEKENLYSQALDQLQAAHEWDKLDRDRQQRFAESLQSGISTPDGVRLSEIRSLSEACNTRLRTALQRLDEAIEGDRLARFDPSSLAANGIETAEELESFLSQLREECEKLLAMGRKIRLR